ncbi:glycosyltransferase family 4 protein [Campylobacter upsaliensis]|uniref:GalNAc-alpha-(1->4)-GalNAc-alpha-(1->3)- diNAcBac-PP-undecaprenol alpha-1,4-N-acetyl-D-galactosaminyltransferase n=1 Tax=Campylobacter upsaliensis TaxID=28080 RepID=UPI001272A16F|nr:glycosyltransferase [Campylobacter upsaliensis]EAH7597414.1 glycosyltransferase family 4 protein [Campylobacter upsaliensis]EAJ7389489.1 glycosyltransferase family 4 protein [Campylobacter upsaliensis]EAJ9382696.1 glycosyltransferase family 4 protein [Campylobacter upsaliensis]EDP6824688.1 glycosyltransferase [Campylobacter upsaliensis]ELS2254613.1 glycosyltransferase [Campylobacter upsaliensis]
MKITFIIATLNSGGAERVLVTLANALCKEHEVKIIKFHAEDSFYKLEKEVLVKTLPQFSFYNLYHKIASRIKKIVALRKALRENESDVFISFLDTTNIACIVAKMGLKTPLIICEHSNEAYLKSKFWRILRRLSYPYAQILSVLGSSDKAFYEKFVKKVVILNNPCHFSLNVKTHFQKENLVLFVGRLDHNKNASMFIKAVALLKENSLLNYRFCIVGDGELRENLENEARNLKAKVEFLGRVEDMALLYERAKVLCLCSFIEGLPTVLIESLYFDVCRISSAYYNGARDLIDDEKDGLLVSQNDEKALALALERVLNDENLREKLVENARKRQKDYELSHIKKQWLDLIRELV